jgi:LytS/YehU family sensor histidine kinase
VHKLGWQKLNIPGLIPRVVIASITMSAIFVFLYGSLSDLLLSETAEPVLVFKGFDIIISILNFSILFALWGIIYFAVKFFQNFKQSEIRNLELRAAKTEIELNSFKAQMNPHFMFNSLNSIRALIDENPKKAKEAITLLSGILRNTLMLGKKQLVPFNEELDLVKKYLSIEKIRFEERLLIEYSIDDKSSSRTIPPFMMQTIVENGIKHGISRLKDGGYIKIKAQVDSSFFTISIVNSGKFGSENDTGIGLSNTRKRLELIYNGRASFEIEGNNGDVTATLKLPIE